MQKKKNIFLQFCFVLMFIMPHLLSAKLLLMNSIRMKQIPSEATWILLKCRHNLHHYMDVIGPDQQLLAHPFACLDTDNGCMTLFQKSTGKKCLIL